MPKSTTPVADARHSRKRLVKPSKVPSPGQLLKTDLDEFAVQADLAVMDARDALSRRLEAAENAWLAARHRLQMAMQDAEAILGDMRRVVSDLVHVAGDADQAIERTKSRH